MSNSILQDIIVAKQQGEKLLAILLDPDKLKLKTIEKIISKINNAKANYIFVGGSMVAPDLTDLFVSKIKELSQLPVVLFPGDYTQLTQKADAVLFLSLLSGRNPEYLIEQQIQAVPFLRQSLLECIATGYILIDGGTFTSTQKVSNTLPISQKEVEHITHTALAGEYQGKKLIYLEAGSGAKNPVSEEIIQEVSNSCSIPIIVGGGIRSRNSIQNAYDNGADLVVIGTAFEEDYNMFENE